MFFHYVLRSLLARPGSNVISVVSIGLVVAASVVALAFQHGVRENLAVTGKADNVVVMNSSVLQTTKSMLSKEAVDALKVLPGVATAEGQPLVSPEAHLQVELDAAYKKVVAARGIEPIAFRVHDQVQIVDGRAPAKGSTELIVGRRLVGKTDTLKLGGSLMIHGRAWPIVGVFSAGGSALENEVWGDRAQLAIELKRPQILCAVLRARSEDDVPSLVRKIGEMRVSDIGRIWGISELEYYQATIGNVPVVARAVAAIVALLVACAVVAAANTLYASLSGKISEFAVLWVVGHRRRRLLGLLFQEALALSLVAGVLACLLAGVFAGTEVSGLVGGDLQFKLPFGAAEVSEAFALAVGIGVLGTVYPGLQVLLRDLAKELS